MWERIGVSNPEYFFTKEELDNAEKLNDKLIGVRCGVECYLPSVIF